MCMSSPDDPDFFVLAFKKHPVCLLNNKQSPYL
jgi:hypothetical protein